MSGITKTRKSAHAHNERGQAAVFLVLALGLFLIGGVGFVVDGANLWFHRQSAQTAADAACTAGAMDMLAVSAGATLQNVDWISSQSVSCPSTSSPCLYAGYNGYSGSQVSGSVGAGSFTSISTDCDYTTHSVCAAADLVSNPYLTVSVNDQVPTTFMRLVGAGPSVSVPARSICGLTNVLSYVPVLVLNPNLADTMTGSGSLAVTFSALATKTPTKLLQVNSTDSDALSTFGGTVDLSNADGSTGNFAIAGQSKPTDAGGGSFNVVNAAGIVSDPFASTTAPDKPAPPVKTLYKVSSPDCPKGITCDIYSPGYWGAGLTVAGHQPGANNPSGLAVFEPGIYYLDGDFSAGQDTCLRPSYTTGNGGVVFYFHSGTVQVNSLSGQLTRKGGTWSCQTDSVPVTVLACPSSNGAGLPKGGIPGNVLLGPCEAPSTDALNPYGDPLGQADPIGEQRGMLFFQDRNSSATPTWDPGSSFGLIGNIYFHNCGSGSGSGANCSSGAFDDLFTLGGSGNGYIVGDVVVDKLKITSAATKVSLNPNPQYYVLKASLLQ